MRLFSVVVGKPGVFLVDIAPSVMVCELQDAIVEQQKYVGFPASELVPLLARQQDLWLSPDDSDAKALMKGDKDTSA